MKARMTQSRSRTCGHHIAKSSSHFHWSSHPWKWKRCNTVTKSPLKGHTSLGERPSPSKLLKNPSLCQVSPKNPLPSRVKNSSGSINWRMQNVRWKSKKSWFSIYTVLISVFIMRALCIHSFSLWPCSWRHLTNVFSTGKAHRKQNPSRNTQHLPQSKCWSSSLWTEEMKHPVYIGQNWPVPPLCGQEDSKSVDAPLSGGYPAQYTVLD